MNTPPEAPAWYLPCDRPARGAARERLPRRLLPPAQAGDRAATSASTSSQVAVGAGCDEIILLVAALGLEPGRVALVHRPTYQLYSVAARNLGRRARRRSSRGSGIEPDWDAFLEAAPRAHVAFICSPNNPTGHEASAELVRAVCRACPGIVLCDQAYLELGGARPPAAGRRARQPDRRPHVLEGLRPRRRARRLRASRSPPLAGALDALRPPGSLSSWSAAVGEIACAQEAEMRERVAAHRRRARSPRRGTCARPASTVEAVAGNFVLGAPADARHLRAPRRRGAWSCARSRTSRCWPATSARPSRTPTRTTGCCAALAELAGGEARPLAAQRRRPARRGAACDEGDAHRRARCSLDGSGRARVATGLGFLDHLLTALAFWWMVDLDLRCSGDLWIDEHHTLEDCAIALGEALDAGARRPRRPDALRRRARAARRGAGRGDDRPLGTRHRAHRARPAGRARRPGADEPAPPLPRHVRAPRPHRPARARRGRGRPPPRRGGVQGDRARAAHRLRAAIPARAGVSSTKGLL